MHIVQFFERCITKLIKYIDIFRTELTGKSQSKLLKAELTQWLQEFQRLCVQYPPDITKGMLGLCQLFELELMHLEERRCRDFRKWLLGIEAEHNEGFLACYQRIQGYLQAIRLNVPAQRVYTVRKRGRLGRLLPLSFDRTLMDIDENDDIDNHLLSQKRVPMLDTRVAVLDQVRSWLDNPSSSLVYWINGMAGTGKTAIATGLHSDLQHELASSLFCHRWPPEHRDSSFILPLVAYQLAKFSVPFRCALLDVFDDLQPNLWISPPDQQFASLIHQPLLRVRDTLPGNPVVIIDALDELKDKECTSQLLEVLLSSGRESNLPIRFIIFSRPEPHIRAPMGKYNDRATSRVVLHELSRHVVQQDIKLYLSRSTKLADELIDELQQKAGVLFIYASLLSQYVSHAERPKYDHTRQLTHFLKSSESDYHREIDRLYDPIVAAALGDSCLCKSEKEDTKRILHLVLTSPEPLHVDVLSQLLDMNNTSRVWSLLEPLWSVLHISETNKTVAPLHHSFTEYMLDPLRSKEYCCDPESTMLTMAHYCFSIFDATRPQLNISGLSSSHLPDSKAIEQGARGRKAIQHRLAYAAQYWAQHLITNPRELELLQRAKKFLSEQLLLWMEVMNLMGLAHLMLRDIRLVRNWAGSIEGFSEDLIDLLHDARRFITAFTLGSALESTPHIYISTLQFWPKASAVSKYYATNIRGGIQAEGTAVNQQQCELLATWRFDNVVRSVAYSPDGEKVSIDVGNALLLNMLTGRLVLSPFKGHTDEVMSVHCSPDGTRTISGSKDETIRTWSVKRPEASPLVQHNASINSVAFAPDGSKFASGSVDDTAHIWGSWGGKLISTLAEHPGFATKTKYSPSGHRIVFCGPQAILVRDAQNGKVVLKLGSNSPDKIFTSVDISPDDEHIAFCFSGSVIYIWSILTGERKRGPLWVPNNSIFTTVSFSPDGTRLVSGSRDGNLYLWDVPTGNLILGPLEGHTDSVTSAQFSPDGAYIISGSNDKSLRLWDATSVQSKSALFPPHIPGTDIVSNFNSGTLRTSFSEDQDENMVPIAKKEKDQSVVVLIACSPKKTDITDGQVDGAGVSLPPHTLHSEPSTPDNYVDFSETTYNSSGIRLSQEHSAEGIDSTQVSPYATCIGTGLSIVEKLDSPPGHTSSVISVGFSPDGAQIISGSIDGAVCAWESQSGNTIFSLVEGGYKSTMLNAYSPIGSRIFSNSPSGHVLLNSQTGRVSIGPIQLDHDQSIQSAAFSTDGTHIILASTRNAVRVLAADTGDTRLEFCAPITSQSIWAHITSIASSPDGSLVAIGSMHYSFSIHDVHNGQLLYGPFDGYTNKSNALAFSPDGTCIVSGSFSTVQVRDAQSGEIVLGPLKCHKGWVTSVDYSPDGAFIVSGARDSSICVWDAQTGEPVIGPVKWHTGAVNSVKFSPDGTRIVSGSDDKTIRVTNVRRDMDFLSDSLTPTGTDWELKEDGWIKDDEEKLLAWVPPGLRTALMWPRTELLISTRGWLRLNFANALIGESWAGCYKLPQDVPELEDTKPERNDSDGELDRGENDTNDELNGDGKGSPDELC